MKDRRPLTSRRERAGFREELRRGSEAAAALGRLARHHAAPRVHDGQRGHDLGEHGQVLDPLVEPALRVGVRVEEGRHAALEHQVRLLASEQAHGVGAELFLEGAERALEPDGHRGHERKVGSGQTRAS